MSCAPTRSAALAALVLAGTLSAAAPTFEKDVRPILKAHCFECHGEGGQNKGGLDLRRRRGLLAGGDGGPAIVPGHPARSRLVQLVASGEMPQRDNKLTPDQVEVLRRWVASGARTARPEPDSLPADSDLTEEERAFWSFQPIRNPEVPRARDRDRVRTPVDAFLVRDLRSAGLQFSPDADRVTLVRRLHLDLLGLPPTPEAVADFLADAAPGAYERLVERLLESRHYGERWGRHWLDVAGYADSDGYSDADPPRPHAWKYRDYVIRSLNEDKPFDRFLVEQLAGDEIARATASSAAAVALGSAEGRELLVATGFLRMAVDGSATDALTDRDAVRNQVVADTLKIVSTALLGLSVGCAQCHDHRYDPIPQTDYYRLRAVLEPAYDFKQWRTPQERLVPLATEVDRAAAAAIESEASQVAAEREARQAQLIAAALARHLDTFDQPLRDRLRAAADTPADRRTVDQKKLLADHPSVLIHPGVLYQYDPKGAEELKAFDARIAGIRSRKPPEDFLCALTEPADHTPVTHRFHRGDHRQPRDAVPPGGLAVLDPAGRAVEFPGDDPDLATTGRRLAFARWLVHPSHPLVARVLVNRVWMHHFGVGLVATPADFGTLGEKPTHPDLLDWLASDFVAGGWSLKQLHRRIVHSTAYRQSSRRHDRGEARDPENRLYWRKPVHRLDAEALRDAILAVSGSLQDRMFGPPVPVRPDLHGQIVVGEEKTEGDNRMPVDTPLHGDEFRRSVYIQVRRSRPLALLHAFDAPVMEVNCERRQHATVATQSLMLMNSAFVLDQSARFARRVAAEAGPDPARRVARAWQLAFQRAPDASELAEALRFLEVQASGFSAVPTPVPAADTSGEFQALAGLCQALLGANEFLYMD